MKIILSREEILRMAKKLNSSKGKIVKEWCMEVDIFKIDFFGD